MSFLGRAKVINLDIGNTCGLSCSKCARVQFTNKKEQVPGHLMTNSEFLKIIEPLEVINFCGQISDPIFHPKFIDFLEISYEKDKRVVANTAASHRPMDWYHQAFAAHKDAEWRFGLDGLPHQSPLYRKGQNGEKLFEVMRLAKSMGIKVVWQCIVFSFNEESLPQIKKMALCEGFDLMIKESSRWLDDDPLKPQSGFLRTKYNSQPFKPKCLNGQGLGHSAEGFVLPCCWLCRTNAETKRLYEDIKEFYDDELNLNKVNSINEILDSSQWKNHYRKLSGDIKEVPKICRHYCGSS